MFEAAVIQGIILAISLAVLARASHYTIGSIEGLIEFLGLSEASAGFAILSVMTSTPEIIVAIFSIIQGTPGVTVGDIMGSNVFNIGLGIGIIAVFGSLKACCTDLLAEMVDILFLSSLIPILLVTFGVLSHFVGAILLGVFVFSVYRIMRGRNPASIDKGKEVALKQSKKTLLAKIAVGMALVVVAARFAVSSASEIALFFGVPAILVGAKIVAIGTSLPELALNFTAVRRGKPRLAMGDSIGSNLSNLTLVLGIVLLVSPFTVDITIFAETLPFLLITTLLLWRFLTKGGVSKVGGILLILSYVLFQAIPF